MNEVFVPITVDQLQKGDIVCVGNHTEARIIQIISNPVRHDKGNHPVYYSFEMAILTTYDHPDSWITPFGSVVRWQLLVGTPLWRLEPDVPSPDLRHTILGIDELKEGDIVIPSQSVKAGVNDPRSTIYQIIRKAADHFSYTTFIAVSISDYPDQLDPFGSEAVFGYSHYHKASVLREAPTVEAAGTLPHQGGGTVP